MKKLLAVLVVAFGAIALPAAAHGGGTDSAGCHTDSRTGIYHCHPR